jgi:S-DNA-T family DNA segregation ATPase FtsK/SpoIIIE
VRECVGVALFAAALIWLIALGTYDAGDPVWFFTTGINRNPVNFVGQVGAFLAEVSFQLAGYAAFLLPVGLIITGWHYFWCRTVDAALTKITGAVLLLACASALFELLAGVVRVGGKPFRSGGYLGEWLGGLLSAQLYRTGSVIVVLALTVLAIILSTQFSFGRFFASAFRVIWAVAVRSIGAYREWVDERRKEKERQDVFAKHTKKGTPPPEIRSPVVNNVPPAPEPAPKPVADPRAPAAAPVFGSPKSFPPVRPPRVQVTPAPPTLPLPDPEPLSKAPAERRKGDYQLPPLALLDAPRTQRKIDERELMDSARLLEEKCREFAVEGTVVQIHPGPVVTTFEFKPDAGVKYSKITSLSNDLCLAMQAESVLIDRIPGKSTVGIQIPNRMREPISLRELLESDVYRRSTSKLGVALGKTIHGEPYVADLAMMPHLLIAGSTGAGKSVGINGMLTSILYRATPDDVRLIMIDPKRLELGMYEDIPHLLTPVVVDPKQAANALRWAVREMEERYKTLAAEGVRNIEQYNRNVQQALTEKRTPKDGELPKPLPFIVVVIDELADLMMVASNEVEESIARLAQMARAVGIHLILATQRPSVDVITGLIKANLPSRISFRVASKIDSRTILDASGAEQLLGRGDMLFLPPATARFIRLHGAYISEQESARLASFLRKQGKPNYDDTITADEKSGPEAIEMDKDDLYDEAARIVVQSGQASISYLQRRLRVGFSRAARLVDMMEMEGLVSPAAGGKPREVLVDKAYFDEVDAQLR